MVFQVENGKIALVQASVVVTYHVKLFRTGADRHNGILMTLLLQVAETMKSFLCYVLKRRSSPRLRVGGALKMFSETFIRRPQC